MKITEEQLFDYIKCPAYYDMKHRKKLGYTKHKTMQSLLDNVANYFFSNLLNKKVATMDELKKKWDSISSQNQEFVNSKRSLEGVNYLVNFARWASENKILIADFNSKYIVKVGDIEVEGVIGPIAVLPGKKCELIVPRFSNKEPEQFDIDKRIKYTLDCYAFREAYGHEISGIKVIHFKNRKEFTTNRTITDFDRLESTIKGVANGVSSDAFYPRESPMCNSCEMKPYCKYWS